MLITEVLEVFVNLSIFYVRNYSAPLNAIAIADGALCSWPGEWCALLERRRKRNRFVGESLSVGTAAQPALESREPELLLALPRSAVKPIVHGSDPWETDRVASYPQVMDSVNHCITRKSL